MSNEEKAKEIIGCPCAMRIQDCEACFNRISLLEMAQWKDAQLDEAFDKALEHHQNKLKEGKITQYGMDNVFAFVENVRHILSHEG